MKPEDVKYDIGIEKHDNEGRTITLSFPNFLLVATYVPNSGKMLKRLDYRIKEWDPDFRTYLEKLVQDKKKPLLVCGDLNIAHKELDIAKPKANLHSAGYTEEEKKEFDKLLAAGFVDTYRALYPRQVI